MDLASDVTNLPLDDVVDLYKKLLSSHQKVESRNDELKQQNHTLQKSLQVLEASQTYLQGELDNINATHARESEEKLKKLSSQNEELKRKQNDLLLENAIASNQNENLSCNIGILRKELEEVKRKLAETKPKKRISDHPSFVEIENERLHRDIETLQHQLGTMTMNVSQYEAQLEELNEQVSCLKDNFESKKSEVEEKMETIETLQDRINEQSMELALLKSAPQEANHKGNSLFAEVDDQRQKMKVIVRAQKIHYDDMKKSLNYHELEIRRLKRDNLNIKHEISTCSNLFQRAETVVVHTLSKRVSELQQEKAYLEKLLNDAEDKFVKLSAEQNIDWVESFMKSANNELHELKRKHFTLMSELNQLHDSFYKAQKELAVVRLDRVKLRILLGRVVDDNNINIDADKYLDIGINHEWMENLKQNEIPISPIVFKQEEEPSFETSDAINESTFILLGGRDKLGSFVPSPVHKVLETPVKDVEDKENHPFKKPATFVPPIKSSPKPLKEQLPRSPSSPVEQQKSVKFSEVVESKLIDETREQYEVSKEARKKVGIIVKRIVIPSKPKRAANK